MNDTIAPRCQTHAPPEYPKDLLLPTGHLLCAPCKALVGLSSQIPMAKPRPELRLDLACGATPKQDFVGVDLYEPKAQKVDLLKFPWPWEDESVLEIHCSHFVEHIPQVYWNPDGTYTQMAGEKSVDLLLRFFDEMWRVLCPGGIAKIIVPALQTVRAFQDPTHRRYIPAQTFAYLNKGFREVNGINHYLGVKCDFAGNSLASLPEVEQMRAAEVQGDRQNTLWNTVYDWHTLLIKPDPSGAAPATPYEPKATTALPAAASTAGY